MHLICLIVNVFLDTGHISLKVDITVTRSYKCLHLTFTISVGVSQMKLNIVFIQLSIFSLSFVIPRKWLANLVRYQ